jgi:predicted DNA-binding transcriptional regulator YafY
MNRTDRLLAIILELQAKKVQRAEDLAATFETSKRTIYRDIQALDEAGVPIVSIPGKGFSLVEGYFLPPLSFSADEATMILLGLDVMIQSFDMEYRTAAEWAKSKVAGVLSESLREKVEWLRESLHFVTLRTLQNSAEAETLRHLRRAIIRQQTVRFRYHARYGEDGPNTPSIREADPYGLIHVEATWLLVAYCHKRKAVRNFRLSRMENLSVLSRTFSRPPGYFMEHGKRRFHASDLVVQLLFDEQVARWVKEDRFFFIVAREHTTDGLLVTLKVRNYTEIVQWVLGWGRHVQVIEPDELRERLAQEAQVMLENFQESSKTPEPPLP